MRGASYGQQLGGGGGFECSLFEAEAAAVRLQAATGTGARTVWAYVLEYVRMHSMGMGSSSEQCR